MRRKGLSAAQFARNHGLRASSVYHALYGTTKGHRGEAHRAAILLGLKRGVIEQEAE